MNTNTNNILFKIIVLFIIIIFKSEGQQSISFNIIEAVISEGYPIEVHYVTTEDNYILRVYRIPHGRNGLNNATASRRAILVSHGMGASPDGFAIFGPNTSLAYLLADHGLDVWMSNSRGTIHSRRHNYFESNDNAELFWDFSWHEMGIYDNPAVINYILNLNGQKNLYYIGHSQGATQFLVMASVLPDMNKKIRMAGLLGAAGYQKYFPKLLIKIISKYWIGLYNISRFFGLYYTKFFEMYRKEIIQLCNAFPKMCGFIVDFLIGRPDPPQFDTKRLLLMATSYPEDFSFKQFIHYMQIIDNGGIFRQFDYGRMKNLEIYGNTTPPIYDLRKITAPVAMYYGKNDDLVSVKDTKNMIADIPNVVSDYLIEYDLFNHIDFLTAKDIVNLLYKQILIDIDKH